MRFENTFEVAGSPAEVIALFEDLPLMASFLPGATVGERNADGSHPATLVVSFGPKRIAFKGSLTHMIDREQQTGTVIGHASADLRGAKLGVQMDYRLMPAAAGTQVSLVSEAEMTGMLAEFARTGGVVVTQALLAEFAQRFSAHMHAMQPLTVAGGGPAAAPQPVPAAAPAVLSVWALLRQSIKIVLRSLWRRSRG